MHQKGLWLLLCTCAWNLSKPWIRNPGSATLDPPLPPVPWPAFSLPSPPPIYAPYPLALLKRDRDGGKEWGRVWEEAPCVVHPTLIFLLCNRPWRESMLASDFLPHLAVHEQCMMSWSSAGMQNNLAISKRKCNMNSYRNKVYMQAIFTQHFPCGFVDINLIMLLVDLVKGQHK